MPAGRLSVYERRNSLAPIVFRPPDKYRIDIHKRFLDGLDPETRAEFTLAGSYGQVTVDARGAHRILLRRNVGRLMRTIRDVNHSEQLTFEQILIADNPPSHQFLPIDRQVTDHHMHRRLDLLGLRRLENERYGFVVIEAEAYARCYKKTYAQKRRLGVIAGDDMPAEIEIDGGHVEGLVVVGGYTQEAMAQAKRLRASHPELRVHVLQNSLVGEVGGLVGVG